MKEGSKTGPVTWSVPSCRVEMRRRHRRRLGVVRRQARVSRENKTFLGARSQGQQFLDRAWGAGLCREQTGVRCELYLL